MNASCEEKFLITSISLNFFKLFCGPLTKKQDPLQFISVNMPNLLLILLVETVEY